MIARRSVSTNLGQICFVDLERVFGPHLSQMPHVLRLLSENHIRATGEAENVTAAIACWLSGARPDFEFHFRPNRILMHDTTCTPALADIAAMRDVLRDAGIDPHELTPDLPVEVSVDHSLAVDAYGQPGAFAINMANEIERNAERYRFMKWAAQSMKSLNVNPPGTGIMHTINMEQLATLLVHHENGLSHPDMMIGTDSHTPMINALGVLAWGVGGLEAESAMFGQPLSLAFPEIVGAHLSGRLPEGVLATDLALEVTHRLRAIGVTGRFVEFYGPGVASLSADDRGVIANMAPEYGATTGFFAADARALDYLGRTARPERLVNAIEPVFRAQGLWFDPHASPHFDRTIEIDLAALEPLIAGPRRPQDRLSAGQAAPAVERILQRRLINTENVDAIPDGAVGIAAITSCTNTTSPRLLVAAGLMAKKAAQYGLLPPAWVKTSLAPGSPSAEKMLSRAGLLQPLEQLGFGIVGFGCTTCIGNSGPLPAGIEEALVEGKAVVAVLSGNRNFPGRVHPKLDLGFLASPPLVVAFALKGHIRGHISCDPISHDGDGKPVYLADLWPQDAAIEATLQSAIEPSDVPAAFASARLNTDWRKLDAPQSACFPWDVGSRNLRRPPFASDNADIRLGQYEAAPLMVLGDDMTTDHISPAGWIDPESAAGQWLVERGGDAGDLNVYASYRGNWEVMLRGLFTNRLARNYLSEPPQPGTTALEDGTVLPIFEAAARLQAGGIATVLFAGERYGMGSSRDWAAKGVALLGVRAVIARSFERIHRSNLIGMGLLPIEICDDFNPSAAGIAASDRFQINAEARDLRPHQDLEIFHRHQDGSRSVIKARAAVDTSQDVEILRAGGILPSILKRMLAGKSKA